MYIGNDPSSTTDNAKYNVAVGTTALDAITTGDRNTAVGYDALTANTTGSYNSASGYQALAANTTGSSNSASGYKAGDVITTGSNNIIIGHEADPSANDASNQIVIGKGATGVGDNYAVIGNADVTRVYAAQDAGATLYAGGLNIGGTSITANATELNYVDGVTSNIQTQLDAKGTASNVTGLSDALVESNSLYIGNDPSSTTSSAEYNVAVGTTALDAITTGDQNTAVGYDALSSNTTGSSNTALGFLALYSNTTGSSNSASGNYALYSNTTGNSNTASGYYALRLNTTGSSNTTLGSLAGDVITTGSNNVIIGYDADASANSATNQIVIGYNATGTGDNEIALGNTSITAIKAQVTSITGYSDERIKREISDNTLGLEFIKKLRPVRYKLKNPADYPAEILEDRFSAIPGSGPGNVGYIRPQDDENYYDGLIAQEVKSAMDEVGIDWSGWSEDVANGKQGLQYGALTVPLIKAVQEQQDMIDSQREMIDLLIEEVKNLKSRIDD